jgi:putative sterol carrier protein
LIRVTYVVGADTYVVDVTEAPPDAQGGAPGGDREVTFTATADLWERMMSGELDPVVAFMQGKLKMAGDHAALYDLLPTFPLPLAPPMGGEAS